MNTSDLRPSTTLIPLGASLRSPETASVSERRVERDLHSSEPSPSAGTRRSRPPWRRVHHSAPHSERLLRKALLAA
eukprot:1060067-Pleurochrysis_carterae.AAC.1